MPRMSLSAQILSRQQCVKVPWSMSCVKRCRRIGLSLVRRWIEGAMFLQGLSSLQLFRLFMTTKGFRQITYCIVLGVPLMQVFVFMLFLTIYMFSVIAHALFGHVANEDETISFKSMVDTWLAMYQIFIGDLPSWLTG